jgi:hypothetical protein
VCELFALALESIYVKLVLYQHTRDALQFENDLNRFAVENGLKVRMASGRVIRTDLDTQIPAVDLLDHYKLFIGIQTNRLAKVIGERLFRNLMEGLFLKADPQMKAMMRMYEFLESDSLSFLEMFDKKELADEGQAAELITHVRHRAG